MSKHRPVQVLDDSAYLLEYAELFRKIEEIGPNREEHHRLPDLRKRLYEIRSINGWGHDMGSHLKLMARVAEIKAVKTTRVDKTAEVVEDTDVV